MTAPLAGARWLPINNSPNTQVQRGEPDEPLAVAHLLSASLWSAGVPNTQHSFRESVAWLMHVVGLGLVSVRLWPSYYLQGFHMFLGNEANMLQMLFNGKHVLVFFAKHENRILVRDIKWTNLL